MLNWPKAAYKLRGADHWPWANATVASFTFQHSPHSEGDEWSVTVAYSYWVDDQIFSGYAHWGESREPSTLHAGDPIQIRYDPRKPKRSYFPEKENLNPTFYLATLLVLGGAGTVVAGFIITHHH